MIRYTQKIFETGHAESTTPLSWKEECWYLPIFGLYHPHKPGKFWVEFDCSAKYDDISLNDVLLGSPDLTKTFLGVLTCFHKELVAVAADMEQMYYYFRVCEDHYNFLHFLCFDDLRVFQSSTWLSMSLTTALLQLLLCIVWEQLPFKDWKSMS